VKAERPVPNKGWANGDHPLDGTVLVVRSEAFAAAATRLRQRLNKAQAALKP
jgi:hypothetical protein